MQPLHKRLAEAEAWELVSLQGYAPYSPRKGALPAGPMSPCVYITCPLLACIASFPLLILTGSIAQADLELCILLLLSPECGDYRHDRGIEPMALGILGKCSLSRATLLVPTSTILNVSILHIPALCVPGLPLGCMG